MSYLSYTHQKSAEAVAALPEASKALYDEMSFDDRIALHKIRSMVRFNKALVKKGTLSQEQFLAYLSACENQLSEYALRVWRRTPSDVLGPVLDLVK